MGGGGGGSASSRINAANKFAESENSPLRMLSDGRVLNTRTGRTSTPSGRYSASKYVPQIQSEQNSQLRILGELYNNAKTAGETGLADTYHSQANKIRDAMGLKPWVDYDPDTGKMLKQGAQEETPTGGYGGYGDYPKYTPINNSSLYKQQAEEKVARIRAAIQRQKTSALGNIQNLESQYGTAIQTAQNQAAQLPGQFTQLNNQVSNRGQVNAQRIRTALAQMGLGQSGTSASQQLEQALTTDNQINENNQQLQTMTNDVNTQVTGLQGEKAAKIAEIQQAIADAEARGDDEAALALSEAQARIAAEASQNAVAQNNWNLQIADRIRAAKEKAEKATYDRGGFVNAYEAWKAEQELKNKYDIAASERDLENKLKLIREEAKYKTSGSSEGLTAGQEETSRKNMNDWVSDKVANDDRLLPDMSNYAALYDAWKTMYVKMNYGG